jgi:inositol transport system substrate-binding protein
LKERNFYVIKSLGEAMKTIYILLTRSGTLLSKLVHFFTADRYTHASISFDDSLQPLYSSARKNGETMFPAGPCREYFHRGFYKKNRQIPCALYALAVPEESYLQAQEEIHRIISRSDEYHFNIAGLFLCRMNIPYNRKRKFFCSQFVAEILRRSEALELPKAPSIMRPSDYTRLDELECVYQGTLQELVSARCATI